MNVLRFSDFIFESYTSSSDIVNTILNSLEGDIAKLFSAYEAHFLKTFERPMSEYDKEMTKLTIIYDMVKAVEHYTQPTDQLITINSYTSPKGNLEISAKIQRSEEVYDFLTEVIYAGGHNIQRLHYRYITKTNLPKTGNKAIADVYAAKIKKLSKVEKLNTEVASLEKRIENLSQIIEENKSKDKETIWKEIKAEKDYYDWPTWQEIIDRGVAKNYNNDEAYFNSQKEENEKRKHDFWITKNITWKEDQKKAHEREIQKLKKKIEAAL
jgi:uncharacterized protein YukE